MIDDVIDWMSIRWPVFGLFAIIAVMFVFVYECGRRRGNREGYLRCWNESVSDEDKASSRQQDLAQYDDSDH